jgi:hypothetical protein
MNPRVSRSSALASKATGFPIAKIAARLAVGYTLDEIVNDITGATPACFEPTIDYVVTKVPRFAFEKFRGSPAVLTTSMKSVGEAMAIGRRFEESFQKALRSLEIGRAGWGCDRPDQPPEGGELERRLRTPSPERIFAVRDAMVAPRFTRSAPSIRGSWPGCGRSSRLSNACCRVAALLSSMPRPCASSSSSVSPIARSAGRWERRSRRFAPFARCWG